MIGRQRQRRLLQHRRTLQAPPSDPHSPTDRIGALAWTPSTGADRQVTEQQQAQLAVAVVGTSGRPTVQLYDSKGRRVDRIPLKPAVKDAPKDFGVTALAFSPDHHDDGGQKLAVAQTDSIVYVYRLGKRKSICHKFPVPAQNDVPVTCLVWPASQPHTLFFGLGDGRIVMGHCRSNDVATLYQAEASATALAVDPQGQTLISAHRNGALWRIPLPDGAEQPTAALVARHPCVPIALAYSAETALLFVGTDGHVYIYDPRDGRLLQALDDGGACRSAAVQGPLLALGGLDSIRVYEQQGPATSSIWRAVGTYRIPGLHLATGLAWRRDGRQLAVGSLCGALDLLDLVEEDTDGASSTPSLPSLAAPTAAGTTVDTTLFQRARALGYEQGIQLLQAHGRLEAAVDAALDSGDFEYALRVCDLSLPRRLSEAHGRHARHLEAGGQYAEAEAAFLRGRDPQGAIDMHLRLGDHAAARRLAQSHAPAALPAVLAAEASALVGHGQRGQAGAGDDEEAARLAQAEALYIKAGQSEQALQQYVEAKAWSGAFRVAQRHCRWRLGDVVAAYEEGRDADGGGHRQQHHDDALTRAYGRRVDGAQHDRYLGQLLRALEIVGGELHNWQVAWAMVRVEEEREGGDGGASVKRARDRLVCVQLRHLVETAGSGKEGASRLALLGSALALLQEKGAPCPVAEPMAAGVYMQLVTRLLGLTREAETAPEGVNAIRAWRRLLHAVLVEQVDRRMRGGAAATTTGEEERAAHEFRHLFLALHHTHVLFACSPHPSLGSVAARAALAALRYAGTLLPADKAFYRAGMALRQHAESLADAQPEEEAKACRHLALLCLNRYVDLVEAIADQDPSLIDPRPLAGCTALPAPSASSLPARQHVTDEGAREAVRTWVLGTCVDMAGRPLRREDGGGLAEALFATPPAHELCAVTGCPLQGPTTVVVPGAGKIEAPGTTAGGAWQPITRANTGAWRAYVEVLRVCPWTGKAIK